MTSDREELTTADLAGRVTSPEDEPVTRDDTSAATGTAKAPLQPLLAGDDTARYRADWEAIQVHFVDEPQASVEQADALVADLMKRLAETFARERETLERQWAEGGEEADTEELRVALQRYRSFFERLLAT
jgi:hypothetical protein